MNRTQEQVSSSLQKFSFISIIWKGREGSFLSSCRMLPSLQLQTESLFQGGIWGHKLGFHITDSLVCFMVSYMSSPSICCKLVLSYFDSVPSFRKSDWMLPKAGICPVFHVQLSYFHSQSLCWNSHTFVPSSIAD